MSTSFDVFFEFPLKLLVESGQETVFLDEFFLAFVSSRVERLEDI
jgi:hypothetical protein